MPITTSEYKRCALVKMDGRIDISTSEELQTAFQSLKDAGTYKIVFDMADVDFMSSKGLWVLIDTQKTCKRYNRGELVLAHVPDKILSTLDLVGMSKYFKIFDDAVSAVGNF